MKRLYEILKVKNWKKKLITAKPKQFDLTVCSLEEILFNITQAEVAHEIMAFLSFVPLLFGGAFIPCFVISVLASLIDIVYIIIQRYNRPRIMKLLKGRQQK